MGIKEDVTEAFNVLLKAGVIENFGHVSAREKGSELFYISPYTKGGAQIASGISTDDLL